MIRNWFGLLLLLHAMPVFCADSTAVFYRLRSGAETAILDINGDGYITWTNAEACATITVERTVSLLPSDWADHACFVQSRRGGAMQIFHPRPPPGMVFIPEGVFAMGDSYGESDGTETPVHGVYVSAFFIDRREVNKVLFDTVTAWGNAHGYSFFSGEAKGASHPIQRISWNDAVRWCNARSEMEGLVPAYYTSTNRSSADVLRSGVYELQTNWVNWATGYRLPTEAEWEKAARGGGGGHRFPWRTCDTIDHTRANFYSNGFPLYDTCGTPGYHPAYYTSEPYTSPTGVFEPNGYGLYDMAGNVSEWCWDCPSVYTASATADPLGAAAGGSGGTRALRGGSWGDGAYYNRVAVRMASWAGLTRPWVGFRTVRRR